MNRESIAASLITAAAVLAFPVTAAAQKYEVGVQFSGMHLHKIDEAPVGVGVRFGYVVTPILTADAELTHCPENSSGNFGETFALAGGRIGKSFERVGIFGKLRGGVIHFGGDYFTQRLDRTTRSMLDAGGVFEYYPNRRIILRIDLSSAVIYYGDARLFNRPDPDALGTVHNFLPGFGVAVRF
jgi:hypothetical protein